MTKRSRRNFLKLGLFSSLVGAAITGSAVSNALRLATPRELEGPFYPTKDQNDRDADLTKIDGRRGVAQGSHIVIFGQILNLEQRPIKDATIDIWQANAHGRYNHPNDPNPQPPDPNFQGWAIISSGDNGDFRFKTVMPGAYPASKTWIRPPHIHFKISKPGYTTLTTQMYFPGEELNKTDLLLRQKEPWQRPLMIAKQARNEEELSVYEYNIVLAKI